MSLQCAISGEPLTADNADEIVVTPSGHLCFKRLLLAKLSENGGVDPFSDSGRPLSEDELVSLQTSKNRPNMPPPPASVSSFTGTLKQLANEYDSVLLELHDTRMALQETRRELSQALYQNDAAVRVVARLSMERDAARQEAQRFQAIAEAAGNSVVKSANGNISSNQDEGAPSKKKPRLDGDDSADLPLSNDIPTADLDTMLGSWEKLHQARRAKPKSTYILPTNWKVANTQSWHKSTCRGLTAMAQAGKFIVTAGKDKQIVVFDSNTNVVTTTISTKCLVSSLGVMPKGDEENLFIVAACGNEVRVYDSSTSDAVLGNCDAGDKIVSADGHPTSQHCVTVAKNGKVAIFRVGGKLGIQHISTFEAEEGTEYSYAALHPDGLLVAAGTTEGKIMLWDLKNKSLASTFPDSVESQDAVAVIAFSSNGYHVAAAYASGAVRVWDMRKTKMLAELNVSEDAGEKKLSAVTALAFHPDGKYLAYGGQGGVHITMVKEWKILAKLDGTYALSILWDQQWIASISDKKRTVLFHEGQEANEES